MTIVELLAELKKANISLAIIENDLVIRGKKQLLSEALLAELRERKLALVAHLQANSQEPLAAGSDNLDSSQIGSLVELTEAEMDRIARTVPGGADNVQDIYPLSPLQEGILFHHLIGGEGDPYLTAWELSFDSRDRLDKYLSAVQAVVQRHDILRTGFAWEGLSAPVQVVWRNAPLQVEEVGLSPADDAAAQLWQRFSPRHFRIDVRQAPVLRIYIAHDEQKSRWLMLQLLHHLAGDRTTLEGMRAEIHAHLLGEGERLPTPLPFRNLVAHARSGVSQQEHDAFFREMLADVDEPTAPFGLLDVHGDGSDIEEAKLAITDELARRVQANARRLGVSAASICHLAWAQVLAKTTGRNDVVFGTVLFGRMQGGIGSDHVLGMFINTLPVRISVGDGRVGESVRCVHTRLAELLRHEHASLAMAQRCSRVAAPAPLFSAILNYRNSQAETKTPQAFEGVQSLRFEERTNYPVTLSVNARGQALSLEAQAPASVDPMRICEFMRTAMESLVDALETAPTRAVSTLQILPPAERRRVVDEWNATSAVFPSDQCVHQLFEEQVARTPDAPAVSFEGQKLSYAELNRRANRLAHHLRTLGVGPDSRVGLCAERSLEMVIGLMAVLKAGGAYVPLDPSYPSERLSFMLEDAGPIVLLTQPHLKHLFAGDKAELPILDLTEASRWAGQPETNLDACAIGLRPDHLAYIIYTSGSTGQPKGAMLEHKGLTNRLSWMQAAYGMDGSDAVLQKTPYSFDVSVWEFFWTLMVGSRLVMALPEGHKDPAYLVEVIRKSNITTVHFVPSMLQVFLEYSEARTCTSLKRVICSGEALPASLVRRLQQLLPQAELHNLYGPTEATVDVTAWTCPRGFDGATVPIGKPIANTRMYILDAAMQPAPIGVPGELYIAGVQVARGYLNRPQLNREKFLTDPFTTDADKRMYRTGDVARWLADGNIEYLGRNDFQVKIRGLRIELGEIETRVADYPGVGEAVVIAREDTPGDKRLVAYYTTAGEQDAIGAEQFRQHLSANLPDYMVPAAYVHMEMLPLSSNGKLDRKALPAPDATAVSSRYEPPQGELETALAEVWADVLQVKRIGRHDNFFELGGHSLLAVQLVLRMQKIIPGEALPLRSLLEAPTIERFAFWLQGEEIRQPRILVQMQAGSPAVSPFFFVSAPDGTVLGMRPLAMALDKNIPLYCIQHKGLDGSERFGTVEEAARCYLDEVRKVQPQGPYCLGGYCFGGIVAFEMARMLEQAGESVVMLFLVDSFNPAYFRLLPAIEMVVRLTRFGIRRAAAHVRTMRRLRPGAWIAYSTGRLYAMLTHGRRIFKRNRANQGGLQDAPVAPSHLEQVLQSMRLWSFATQRTFLPQPYGGDATVFRASWRSTDPYDDHFLGWKPVISGALQSFEIESQHDTIFRDPAVRQVAERISARITGAIDPHQRHVGPEHDDRKERASTNAHAPIGIA